MSREDSLYQEHKKLDFINSEAFGDEEVAKIMRLFRASAPLEKELGRDLSEMTWEEVEPVLGVDRRGTKNNRIRILNRYRAWAGVPGSMDNATAKDTRIINMDKLDDVVNSTFRSPEHLQRCLDEVFDPEDDETMDNAFRCYVWLAYGGMPEDLIHQVEAGDVDFKNRYVSHGGHTAVLYAPGIKSVRNCVNLERFRYGDVKSPGGDPVYRMRANHPSIIRGVRGKGDPALWRKYMMRRIEEPGTERSKEIYSRLNYKKVWKSGVFYRMYEKELAGMRPNFLAAAMDSPMGLAVIDSEDIEEKKRVIGTTALKLEDEYICWKYDINSI